MAVRPTHHLLLLLPAFPCSGCTPSQMHDMRSVAVNASRLALASERQLLLSFPGCSQATLLPCAVLSALLPSSHRSNLLRGLAQR